MSAWRDLRWWESREWERLKELLDGWEEQKDFVPNRLDIFRALVLCPLDRVKCIILGQDPYPQPGIATGLAFSIRKHHLFPATLRNIYSEYCTDLGYIYPKTGDLTKWAREGVLLWNTHLTCTPGASNSHKGLGWDALTKQVLEAAFDETNGNVVFILWGKEAQKVVYDLNFNHPTVIQSAHPSPLSAHAGFFGSRPFSRCNAVLASIGKEPIYWKLD